MPPVIVQHLCAIPPEIVHNVFNDLPLGKILQLASYDVEYLDDCILSHLVFKDFFLNEKSFIETKAYFKLYSEICRYFRHRIIPDNSKLSTHITKNGYKLSQLNTFFHTFIHTRLQKAIPHLPLLSLFSDEPKLLSPVWNSSNIAFLQKRWNAIKTAEQKFNTLKSQELVAVAALYAAHPDILKQTMDPGSFQRDNADHILLQFRLGAKRLAASRLLWKPSPPRYTFRFDTLPIIPHDAELQAFVAALASRKIAPVARRKPAANPLYQKIPVPEDLSALPPDIASVVQVVCDGMAYIYTRPDPNGPARTVLRTKSTPYSAKIADGVGDSKVAQFVRPDSHEQPGERPLWRLLPHHEKELEWLGAFVKASVYFKTNP